MEGYCVESDDYDPFTTSEDDSNSLAFGDEEDGDEGDGADQEDGDEDNFVEENCDVSFTVSFHSHALRKNQTFGHKSR